MPDHLDPGIGEHPGAEHMIRMHVGQDQVRDGQIRGGPHRREQRLAFRPAAAGIDDRDTLVADDETQVGDVAQVVRVGDLLSAGAQIDTGRDLGDLQRLRNRLRGDPRAFVDAVLRPGGDRQQPNRQQGQRESDMGVSVQLRHLLDSR
jgi:hypothetical protein